MKKIFAILLVMLFLNVPFVSADNGDIVGNIYSTDILAKINGSYVESYSLNGKTAIILEDLAKYGAEVIYSDDLRTLIVDTGCMNNIVSENVKRGKVGAVVGNIYSSDIEVVLNGYKIKAFSLNGKMAVAVENLGDDNSYSLYNAKYEWSEAERTISLSVLTHGYDEVIDFVEKSDFPVGTVYDRFDTEDYTFVYMVVSLRDGGHEKIFRVGKNGGFIEYEKMFKSVSYNGSREFENTFLDKENETFKFHYDFDYVIDLKTGAITRS